MPTFAHLHVHSCYSLRDSVASIDGLVGRARQLGMPALALTDHGNLYGAVAFAQACKAAGIKWLLGSELYVAPGSRLERGGGYAKGETYDHLVVLARDQRGWRNLVALVTRSWEPEAFYYKPRVDRALLEEHAAGLLVLSGCYGGRLARLVLAGRLDEARAEIAWGRATFGPDGYWVELQRHANLERLDELNATLVDLADAGGVGLVATGDVHYVLPEDADAHACWLADDGRPPFSDGSYYLASPAEMAARFADLPRAVEAAGQIAELCQEIELGGVPDLPCPDQPPGEPDRAAWADRELRRLTQAGLVQRFGTVAPEAAERAEYELGVFARTGFSAYPLLIADILRFCRGAGIPFNPRGSAAGSLVLYALGVSHLDPLRYGLVFERFLNPERVELPDVDLDVAHDRRAEVFDYLVGRYGRESVAQIITFTRMGPKAALRAVGRAWGQQPLADRLSRALAGGPPTLRFAQALGEDPEHPELRADGFVRLLEQEPGAGALVAMARRLEGLVRDASVHACGIVIAEGRLADRAPLRPPPEGDRGGRMVQWDMAAVAAVGLLKVDILGLDNLSAVALALDLVAERGGPRLGLEQVPLDDPAVFGMLGRGETQDVFQLSGGGMTRLIKEFQPSSLLDVTLAIAAYRPGPMERLPDIVARKHGRKPIVPLHPALEATLADSYGECVFQEQILEIARIVAGYSLGRADKLRKAMGKKQRSIMDAEREPFVAGALAQGFSEEFARRLFELLIPFSGYGFNRSHALAYAQLALVTAWLKCHYPAEYFAALLTARRERTDKLPASVAAARRLGVPVLPPDVNRSTLRFGLEDGPGGPAIRYALGAIRTVSEAGAGLIVAERLAGGPFTSLDDLAARVDLRAVKRPTLEALVKVGALDELARAAGAERGVLLGSLDALLAASGRRAVGAAGSLFGGLDGWSSGPAVQLAAVPPASLQEALAWERALAGSYLSADPLAPVAATLERVADARAAELEGLPQGEPVCLGGILAEVEPRRARDRTAAAWARATLLDPSGAAELLVFSRAYTRLADRLLPDRLVLVRGMVQRAEREDDPPVVVVDDVELLDVAATSTRGQAARPTVGAPLADDQIGRPVGPMVAIYLRVVLPEDGLAARAVVASLKDTFDRFRGRGTGSIFFDLLGGPQARSGRVHGAFPVDAPALQAALVDQLGAQAVRLLRAEPAGELAASPLREGPSLLGPAARATSASVA